MIGHRESERDREREICRRAEFPEMNVVSASAFNSNSAGGRIQLNINSKLFGKFSRADDNNSES